MILKSSKPRPNYYDNKEVIRYALIPTKLKRASDDKTGEIIWLEKYVKIYTHDRKSNKTWTFKESLRFSVHVLNKLEETNKEKGEDIAHTNYSGLAGSQSMPYPHPASPPPSSIHP